RDTGVSEEEARTTVAQAFFADLRSYGPLIKHHSFEDEREWRLVSALPSLVGQDVKFRPGPDGVIVSVLFRLNTAAHSDLGLTGSPCSVQCVQGPSPRPLESQRSLAELLKAYFPHSSYGPTDTTFRG